MSAQNDSNKLKDLQQRQSRLDKLKQLEDMGINTYPHKYAPTHKASELQNKYQDLEADKKTDDIVKVAGRIRAYRNSGMFIDLYDESGKIQISSYESNLSPDEMKKVKLLDIGDIIGVEGKIAKTKRGELSVEAANITVLAKALLPLPEKYHGLTDVEKRYRQRYLDLIMNEDVKEVFTKRSKIISSMRHYLEDKGFMEVETPVFQPIPGGTTAKPFITHHNSLDIDLYLRIAPELYLKRLIVGGFEKIFEIGKNFRNEGISVKHNPEYSNFELYWAYADYYDIMALEEDMLNYLAKKVTGSEKVKYGDREIDFSKPFKRAKILDLIKEHTEIDFMQIENADEAIKAAKKAGISELKGNETWGKVVEIVFEELIEPTLIQPTFVMDFPVEVSPLTKVHRDNKRLTERFDLYINGWEIGPAYSELTDPRDQRERFEAQMTEREKGDDEAMLMDTDFLNSLEYGCPPLGGIGIGIDRLIMLLTDSPSIRDVIAFPTMKVKFKDVDDDLYEEDD
jgi:lysyl-tRNA synthetase class 2